MANSYTYDLRDVRVGKLVVGSKRVEYVKELNYKGSNWRCECDCGNVLDVRQADLIKANVTDCGCVEKEKRFKQLLVQRHKKMTTA